MPATRRRPPRDPARRRPPACGSATIAAPRGWPRRARGRAPPAFVGLILGADAGAGAEAATGAAERTTLTRGSVAAWSSASAMPSASPRSVSSGCPAGSASPTARRRSARRKGHRCSRTFGRRNRWSSVHQSGGTGARKPVRHGYTSKLCRRSTTLMEGGRAWRDHCRDCESSNWPASAPVRTRR